MVSCDQLPSYAYIPGKNQRHPEDAFELIRQTAVAGHSAEQLACCDAFQAGLRFLDAGFYWEAHEVLEPVWMLLPKDSEERLFVQGLIQLANGYLKLQMDRPKASLRLVAQVRDLVPTDTSIHVMTLSVEEVHSWNDVLEKKALLVI